jgi:UDP-2,4-diacetamido-2,4,6-trideoxy-beta-L-altropyranose hydrolase
MKQYRRTWQLAWIKKKDEVLAVVKNADILIIDSYLCPASLYRQLAAASVVTAYIDDNIRLHYPAGVIINGVMCAERMNYPAEPGTEYLLGQEYSFLRKEFWEVPEKKIRRHIDSVMITCGGNDQGGLSYRVLRSLVENYPALKISVVLKNLDTPYLEYYQTNATVLTGLNALQMRELMMEADIAITASGQTTYELCRVGTPFIAVTTAANQLFSIQCFYEHGLVAAPVSSRDEEMENSILAQFRSLSDEGTRQAIHEKMKKAINGKGSLKVVEHLLTCLSKKSNYDTRRN